MSKNFVCGVGVLGLVGLAVYIYQEHKKKKEKEAESLIYLDDYIAGEENSNGPDEQGTEQEQKNSFSAKVSKVCSRIGKSVGTAVLKFGAKHPKAAQFILRFGHYIPYAIVGTVLIGSIPFYGKAKTYIDGMDPDSVIKTDDGIEFARVIPEEEFGRGSEKDLTSGWDEKYRANYDAVKSFADSLNLFEGEMFVIEDQKQYIGTDLYPKLNKEHPIVSHLIFGNGVYPEKA